MEKNKKFTSFFNNNLDKTSSPKNEAEIKRKLDLLERRVKFLEEKYKLLEEETKKKKGSML